MQRTDVMATVSLTEAVKVDDLAPCHRVIVDLPGEGQFYLPPMFAAGDAETLAVLLRSWLAHWIGAANLGHVEVTA